MKSLRSLLQSIKFKALLLALLLSLCALVVLPQTPVAACEECVALSGGLCVGCMGAAGGHVTCLAEQVSCTCSVSGNKCEDGIGGEGGGN